MHCPETVRPRRYTVLLPHVGRERGAVSTCQHVRSRWPPRPATRPVLFLPSGSSWGESSSGRITNWLVLKNLTPQVRGRASRCAGAEGTAEIRPRSSPRDACLGAGSVPIPAQPT